MLNTGISACCCILALLLYICVLLQVDRIIFCVFQKVDCNWYSKLLHYYYPVPVKERTVELPETRVKRGMTFLVYL